MAKVYKVELFLVDKKDEFKHSDIVKYYLEHRIDAINEICKVKVVDVNESNHFEWDEYCELNKNYASKEDFEKYFEGKW